MKIVIIQEAGRHEKNRNFRESLNLHRALSRIDGVESKVWGLNYQNFSSPFSEIEKWADVIFIIENYTSKWMPLEEISKSNKLKIFWSIDSHYDGVVNQHSFLCKILKIDILLNSSEQYIRFFETKNNYWFPNAYPDDLIYPLGIEKIHNIGFCGNDRPEIHYLDKFGIKKDLFLLGDDMVKSINSYKIHFNKNIRDDINYRTFETCGCKIFLLTNHSPNLEKLFKIGEELVTYNSLPEIDDILKYYLENEDKRINIENAGYERVKKDHTYFERSKFLVEIIKKYI
jgi:hypothetical protein